MREPLVRDDDDDPIDEKGEKQKTRNHSIHCNIALFPTSTSLSQVCHASFYSLQSVNFPIVVNIPTLLFLTKLSFTSR